jgi:hypothetical protein
MRAMREHHQKLVEAPLRLIDQRHNVAGEQFHPRRRN